MIRPSDIDDAVWEVVTAAKSGDIASVRRLLDRDPDLIQRGYFYTPPIHFAVREGHLEIVELLLASGADPEWNGHYGISLAEMAKERGHDAVAAVLEKVRNSRGRTAPAETRKDHPIHGAAQALDLRRVRELLDADPTLLNRGDRAGGTPLHRAVAGSARDVVEMLLDRGADIHAIHGAGLGSSQGFSPYDVQAIDIAIWGGFGRRPRPSRWTILKSCLRHLLWEPFQKPRSRPRDLPIARLLLSRGAAHDLTVASALGDFDRVKSLLAKDPAQIREARLNGRRALTAAVEFGHDDIARFLLEHGADPTWPESGAGRGGALHAASRQGNLPMVELLLAHHADPNSDIDSAGNAVFAAKTPEIRALLKSHGGTIDPYDLVWLNEDDEVMSLIQEDPKSAERGCGGIFTAVVTRQKRDLLKRLLDAGVRVPPVVTGCQSYLLEQADMLLTLLDSGMNPDTCSWQGQTLLHCLCRPDPDGKEAESNTLRAAMLLDAGASISAREDQYSSTPLGWAARHNNPAMVNFLLSRGAPTNLPDDKTWATPLAWATRRGHSEIVSILRAAGANS
jgi:ankyrin repeat protein